MIVVAAVVVGLAVIGAATCIEHGLHDVAAAIRQLKDGCE